MVIANHPIVESGINKRIEVASSGAGMHFDLQSIESGDPQPGANVVYIKWPHNDNLGILMHVVTDDGRGAAITHDDRDGATTLLQGVVLLDRVPIS